MELCGYTYSYDRLLSAGELDTAGAIRFHRELGVIANEVTDRYVRDEELPGIAAALAAAGARVAVYDVAGDFTAADGSAPPDQLARALAGVDRAARLGAARVLVVPGAIAPDVDPAIVRRHYAEVVRACLDRAAAHGMMTMAANLGSQAAYCGTPAHLAEVGAAVGPALRLTYDVGNFLMAGEDTIAALGRVAPRVAHVHFKDWTIHPADAAPVAGAFRALDGRQFLAAALGDGVVDLPGALARLREVGYRGTLSVEYEGPEDPCAAVARSIDYLRRRLGVP